MASRCTVFLLAALVLASANARNRRRRKLSGDDCRTSGCATGEECTLTAAGRRLFGAPAANAYTCVPASSPPPSPSPSPPPPSYDYSSNGVVTSLAGPTAADDKGFADGTGTSARFNQLIGLAMAPDGSSAYMADYVGRRIRAVVVATGVVTTLAGSGNSGTANGVGTAASFQAPHGITATATTVFMSDYSNHRIRAIDIATRTVTDLVGAGGEGFADGTGAAARFKYPIGLDVSPDGATILVADWLNYRIRSVVVATGVVTTLAGSGSSSFADGTGVSASFNQPRSVAHSPDGTAAFVTDQQNRRIRKIIIATGVVTTLAGTGGSGTADGPGASATFSKPYGLTVTPDGTTCLVADQSGSRIRAIVIATGAVTTVAGSSNAYADGTGTSASFIGPTDVKVTPDGAMALVSTYQGSRVRAIAFSTI